MLLLLLSLRRVAAAVVGGGVLLSLGGDPASLCLRFSSTGRENGFVSNVQ